MSDVNLVNYYDRDSGRAFFHERLGEHGSNPNWDDTLKITSRAEDITVIAEEIRGGKEDCVDINNHAYSIGVLAKRWFPQGKYLATIKGGASRISLTGDVYSHGKEVDVDLGNMSDQSREPVTGVSLALRSQTGKPVVVRVLNAEKPLLARDTGPYRYAFPHPDAWYHGIMVRVLLFLDKFGLV